MYGNTADCTSLRSLVFDGHSGTLYMGACTHEAFISCFVSSVLRIFDSPTLTGSIPDSIV
jgi:hypothetical protein